MKVFVELLEPDLSAERHAVVQDVEVQPIGIDHDLAIRPDEPCLPQVPLPWDNPIEHRGTGGNLMEREGRDAPQDPQRAPHAVTGDAATDRVQLADQRM